MSTEDWVKETWAYKNGQTDPELPTAFDFLGYGFVNDGFLPRDIIWPDDPLVIPVVADEERQYLAVFTDGEHDDESPLRQGWYVFEDRLPLPGEGWCRAALDGPLDTFDEALEAVHFFLEQDRKEKQ